MALKSDTLPTMLRSLAVPPEVTDLHDALLHVDVGNIVPQEKKYEYQFDSINQNLFSVVKVLELIKMYHKNAKYWDK